MKFSYININFFKDFITYDQLSHKKRNFLLSSCSPILFFCCLSGSISLSLVKYEQLNEF